MLSHQGDVTRRFLRRTLQLAVLCALLIIFRIAVLRLVGAGGQAPKPAADLLPVKRPRSAQESSWYKRFCRSDGINGGGSAAASLRLPLLSDALHVRTWPAAGAKHSCIACAVHLSSLRPSVGMRAL